MSKNIKSSKLLKQIMGNKRLSKCSFYILQAVLRCILNSFSVLLGSLLRIASYVFYVQDNLIHFYYQVYPSFPTDLKANLHILYE